MNSVDDSGAADSKNKMEEDQFSIVSCGELQIQ